MSVICDSRYFGPFLICVPGCSDIWTYEGVYTPVDKRTQEFKKVVVQFRKGDKVGPFTVVDQAGVLVETKSDCGNHNYFNTEDFQALADKFGIVREPKWGPPETIVLWPHNGLSSKDWEIRNKTDKKVRVTVEVEQ